MDQIPSSNELEESGGNGEGKFLQIPPVLRHNVCPRTQLNESSEATHTSPHLEEEKQFFFQEERRMGAP